MNTRRLGESDLSITPVGFGAWAIGGGAWEFGGGPQDDQRSVAAIREALAVGVNWIDTAPDAEIEKGSSTMAALERAGKVRNIGVSNFSVAQMRRAQAISPILQTIGKRHGRAPGEVAIAWVLREPAVTAAIAGVRGPEQVRGLSCAAYLRLD